MSTIDIREFQTFSINANQNSNGNITLVLGPVSNSLNAIHEARVSMNVSHQKDDD